MHTIRQIVPQQGCRVHNISIKLLFISGVNRIHVFWPTSYKAGSLRAKYLQVLWGVTFNNAMVH